MFCYNCGKELPTGASRCPACQATVFAPPSGADPVDQFVADIHRSTKELLRASAKLSKHVVTKVGEAAKDPPASAKKASEKIARELERIAAEIDRELKEL